MIGAFFTSLFWLSAAGVLYTYGLFAATMWLWALLRPKPVQRGSITPNVSVILAVHNEEEVIAERIKNLLALDYPDDKLEIVIVSDGSTDGTNAIAGSFAEQGVRLETIPTQKGKSSAQNAAASLAKGEILVFTDADTTFAPDFLLKLLRSFSDPSVGCVTGRLIYTNIEQTPVAQHGGSLYWRYELWLKSLESRAGVLFATSGQCMAVRRELFRPIEEYSGDDCVVPLNCLLAGYRVVYEPEALAWDVVQTTPKGEFSSRVRMTVRTIQGMLAKGNLLKPWRHPALSVTIVSHKFLRYAVPLMLIVNFASALALAHRPGYRMVLAAQVAFYLLGLLGWLVESRRGEAAERAATGGFGASPALMRLLQAPYTFCLANAGFFVGLVQTVKGQRVFLYTSGE